MAKKRVPLAERPIQSKFLYVPSTLDIFKKHLLIREVKVSASKAERLFSLYRYFLDEKDIVMWPKDRPMIEDSLPYYKKHGDAVLDADIKLLKKIGILQAGIGLFEPSFMDVMFGGFL